LSFSKRVYQTAPLDRKSIFDVGNLFDDKAEFLKSGSDAVWTLAAGTTIQADSARTIWAETGTRNEAALKRSLAEAEYRAPALLFGRFHSCLAEPSSIRLVTTANKLITETTAIADLLDPEYRDADHLIRRGDHIRRLRRTYRVVNQDVLFAINSFCASYGHFVLTTLPIVFSFLYEIRAGTLKVLIPDGTPKWMTSILLEIGLPEAALLCLPNQPYQFRSAIASNILDASNTRAPHPNSLHWASGLQDRERECTPSEHRIFVKRSLSGNLSSRTISNEEDVTRALKLVGFEVVEPATMSLHEQAEAFRGADVIVSPHGSTFANLIFCRPGTKVLDLMPDSWVGVRGDSLRDVWVARLCAARALHYSVLLCPSTNVRIHATGNPEIVCNVDPSILSNFAKTL
jgi:capsular polysaccharide biosynthesis protein